MAYYEYLKSEKWQAVRLEALVREKAHCQICGEESISNDAHHVWYPESVWDTTEAQLVILCRPCHDFLHVMLPECKTNDEEAGRSQWLKFSYAIAAWRRSHASIFKPKESPKELREELQRVKALLSTATLPHQGFKPIIPIDTIQSQLSAVVMLIKKWAKAYDHSASCVNNPVADSDYQI